MKSKRAGKFIINGITVTAVALLMRSVAVIFNAYVARTVGAEAVGLYSLLSGVYGFALTLALSGINLSVTRLVSEYLAIDDKCGAVSTLKKSFLLALGFGTAASALLFFLSDFAASSWLHEMRVIVPLRWLCLTLPAAAVSSVINGYFTAVRRVYKNALSQFIEMAVKIAATVILFTITAKKNAEMACILLALSGVVAEICSLLFNLTVYFFDRKYHLSHVCKKSAGDNTGKKILGISMPVALTSYFRSALLSVEHSLIPKGLLKYGADRESALAAYGTLGSMALTVINFPYALIGSFASLLIPEITESRAKGKKRHIRYLAYRTYQASSVFAFCLMGIFYEFSDEIGNCIYSSQLAGEYIKSLSFIVPVMYTDTVTDSLLKGMGEQLYSMKVNIADAVISVILVLCLVPRYGIIGYIVTIYIAEIINTALSISKAVKVCKVEKNVIFLYVSSAFAALGALSVSRLIVRLMSLPTFLHVFVYIGMYLALIRITAVFDMEDVLWFKTIFKKQSL